MQFDVCFEMVFTNLPIEERIARIAQAGYSVVEFWFPDGRDAAAIKQACDGAGVRVNDIVVNGQGGPASPVQAEMLNAFLERVDEVIDFAKQIDCHMAISCTGNLVPGLTRAQMHANCVDAYGRAAELAAKRDFTLVIEPLNIHVDHAGYFLDSSDEGAAIVREVNSPNVKLLYDIYHMQIMEGNLAAHIEKHIDVIGHFHSAGVPGRHELFGSEINYPYLIERINALGYQGCFGLEYSPAMADHAESLKQTLAYLSH